MSQVELWLRLTPAIRPAPLRGMERVQASLGGERYADVIVGELRGNVTSAALERGLAALLYRYPALSRRVRTDPVHGWVADPVPPTPIVDVATGAWEDEIESLLRRGYDGPSCRLLLVHGAGTHHVALSVHHALVDGRSLSALLDELLRASEGEELGPRVAIAPSAIEFAPQWMKTLAPVARAAYAARLRSVRPTLPFDGRRLDPGEQPGTRFAARTIDPARFAGLRAQARSNAATVGGALVEAARSATADLAGPAPIEVMVDVRPMLPEPAQVGMFASGVPAWTPSRGTAWQRARIAAKSVQWQLRLGTPLLAHAAFEGVDAASFLDDRVDLSEAGGVVAGAHVSNVGCWTGRTTYGRRQLRSVFSATSAIRGGPALIVFLRTVEGRGCLSAIANHLAVDHPFLERWLDAVTGTLADMAASP